MSAESDYYEAKRSYNRAVAERQSLRNQESACCSARANAASNIQNAQTNKINFEKRLAEIEKINNSQSKFRQVHRHLILFAYLFHFPVQFFKNVYFFISFKCNSADLLSFVE